MNLKSILPRFYFANCLLERRRHPRNTSKKKAAIASGLGLADCYLRLQPLNDLPSAASFTSSGAGRQASPWWPLAYSSIAVSTFGRPTVSA